MVQKDVKKPKLSVKRVRKHLYAEHSRVRALHGVPGLTVNCSLEKQAQKWANKLAKSNKGLQHSSDLFKGDRVGENVYSGYHSAKSPDQIGCDAISTWYSEIDKFNFGDPNGSLTGCGHFTQVMWKSSKQVGLGVAISDDGNTVYVVGQYFPAGNFAGNVAENIKPPKSKRAQFEEVAPSGPEEKSLCRRLCCCCC